MKNAVKITAVLMLFAVLLVSCGGTPDPIGVDDLTISSVAMVTNSTDTTKPPVTYSATVTWSLASITADETASAALEKITIELGGSDVEYTDELSATATTYTFTDLLPGDQCWLKVSAVYAEGTYEDEDYAYEEKSFLGGPWYKSGFSSSGGERRIDTGFGVGSVNWENFAVNNADTYYYNTYNYDYVVDSYGDESWLVIGVNEVTATNDTSEQRNNINWLSDDVYLLDNGTLWNGDDLASVDLEIYTIYGTKIFELTGTATSGTISATNFNSLLDSVNSGYYADKEGVFFIRAICKAAPSSFSSSNSSEHGWWGVAMPGSRVSRD